MKVAARFRLPGAVLVAGLVCASAGCQQLGAYRPSWFSTARKAPKEPPALDEPKLSRKAQTERKFALARSLEQSGQLKQAVFAYEMVLQTDRKHAGAHHRLAILRELDGQADKADEHFQAALKQEPQNAELLCDYGYSLYLRGQLPMAEQQLRAALAAAPEHARAHSNLALIQARTGRIDAAVASFQAAGCHPASARANVAFALMLQERWNEAREQLDAALAYDPASPLLRDRLQELDAVIAKTAASGPAVAPASHAAPVAPQVESLGAPVVKVSGLAPAGGSAARYAVRDEGN
jgi:Flp pilus assembly protein TadD